ncbi:hypothetical protein Hanom_Chr04g00332381 [Helianthus anomalus]
MMLGCVMLITIRILLNDIYIYFFERQIWITDGPLEYHRATRGTTRSYPSPLGIMSHQFRRKPNKHGKTPLWESNPGPIGPKALSHHQDATRL